MNTANRWNILYHFHGTSSLQDPDVIASASTTSLSLYLIALVLPVVEVVEDADVTTLITGIDACSEMYEPCKNNQT